VKKVTASTEDNIFNEAGFVIVGKINLGSNLLIAKNSFINFELLRQE
tara:strand:+ start:246 stop:386 length:141 start_codon:yes stop_codon:yes gene_type:complete